MIREICKDEFFLSQKAEPAAASDLEIAQDLLDTLTAHKDGCVGMAANMIGINKRIIAFDNIGTYMVMFNPVIVKKSAPYDEMCIRDRLSQRRGILPRRVSSLEMGVKFSRCRATFR